MSISNTNIYKFNILFPDSSCKGNTLQPSDILRDPFEVLRYPSKSFDIPSIPFEAPRYPFEPLRTPSIYRDPPRSPSAHSPSFGTLPLSTLVVLRLRRNASNSLNGSSNPSGYPG